MGGELSHWASSYNHVWRPSSQCRRRDVDGCGLWESPKISTLESVACIPTGDSEFFIPSFIIVLPCLPGQENCMSGAQRGLQRWWLWYAW